MAKVIRSEKHGIQMIRAKELVPGDVVEVSGFKFWKKNFYWIKRGCLLFFNIF